MFLTELFESLNDYYLVVTYPGRFQPFGLNHKEVYELLQSQFGRDNVYIVTSNVVKDESPFDFSDRVKFMTAQGVFQSHILESNSPYNFPKQLENIKNRTVFITAMGQPDADRLSVDSTYQAVDKRGRTNTRIPAGKQVGDPTYYKTWEGMEKATTADKHGFVYIVPEQEKLIKLGGEFHDVSHGTAARDLWNQVRSNPEQRAEYLMQMFGRNDPELGVIMDKIPAETETESVSTRVPKLPKPVMAAGFKKA